jgi:hypothetical protein
LANAIDASGKRQIRRGGGGREGGVADFRGVEIDAAGSAVAASV